MFTEPLTFYRLRILCGEIWPFPRYPGFPCPVSRALKLRPVSRGGWGWKWRSWGGGGALPAPSAGLARLGPPRTCCVYPVAPRPCRLGLPSFSDSVGRTAAAPPRTVPRNSDDGDGKRRRPGRERRWLGPGRGRDAAQEVRPPRRAAPEAVREAAGGPQGEAQGGGRRAGRHGRPRLQVEQRLELRGAAQARGREVRSRGVRRGERVRVGIADASSRPPSIPHPTPPAARRSLPDANGRFWALFDASGRFWTPPDAAGCSRRKAKAREEKIKKAKRATQAMERAKARKAAMAAAAAPGGAVSASAERP